MQIFINDRLAAIKSGSSIEFVSENRYFSGADGYSLTITFPLNGCKENLEIFGNICRQDIVPDQIIFDCCIMDGSIVKTGVATIVEINDAEVKCQFLEGRSAQNFDSAFDDIFINELDLGRPYSVSPEDYSPEDAWDAADRGMESVALPWVNNSSESGLLHNCAEYVDGGWSWSSETYRLTFQPYLVFITQKICEALGYVHDLDELDEDSMARRLIICNTLPPGWDIDSYAAALPHWSVSEYFEKLEAFLDGQFEIDHKSKIIMFRLNRSILDELPAVEINDVIEEFSSEVKAKDQQCDYIGERNLEYKDAGGSMWKFYSCDWFIEQCAGKIYGAEGALGVATHEYETLSDLLSANRDLKTWNGLNQRGNNRNKILYAKDVDMYFVTRAVSRQKNGSRYSYKCILQPVNIFGAKLAQFPEEAENMEIEFVPASIDYTEEKYGEVIFLDVGNFSESAPEVDVDSDYFYLPKAQQLLEGGETEKSSEYFSSIFVAWWDGKISGSKLPHPYVQTVSVDENWEGYKTYPFSLRLNDSKSDLRSFRKIDPKRKTTFKFLSEDIPDARSLFYIRGQKYLCEKITATFTENGMSRLLKGEFFPVLD